MTEPTEGWVLWAGTVGFDGPLPERLGAAAATGYRRVSLSPLDVLRAEAAGITATDLGSMAADLGLRWILDPLVSWLPAGSASRSPFAAVSTSQVIEMGEALRAVSATAIALTSKSHSTDELALRFASLCEAAAAIGMGVHLEFIPMTVVDDLATAWNIARTADRPNGGLVFDTWHFFRGNPDFAALAEVPGERIFAVQINDADATPVGPLWEDTFNRRLPGDGSFDLNRVMAALGSIGGLSWIGPEVFAPHLASLGPPQAARIARDRIIAI